MLSKSRKQSQKKIISLLMSIIILMTFLLSVSLFLYLLDVKPDLLYQARIFFIQNRWWMLTCIFLMLLLGITALVLMSIQMEKIVTRRMKKIYTALEVDSLRGITSLPIGVVSCENDEIVWLNNFFSEEEKKALLGQDSSTISSSLMENGAATIEDIERGWTLAQNVNLFDRVVDTYHDTNTDLFYLIDRTEEYALATEVEDKRLVVGYIYSDTPEELRVIEDAGNIDVGSELHRIVVNWAQGYNAYARKYSSYRWMIVGTHESLELMIRDEMNIRQEIQRVSQELKLNITISGGFAEYHTDMVDVVKQAVDAIEFGQSRGGDQIVVQNYKEGTDALIFGGDNNQKKRTSRVMARSTSIALHALLEKYDEVYITGHQFADLDAIGAILGFNQIVLAEKKKVHFVVDLTKIGEETRTLFNQLNSGDKLDEIIEDVISPHKFRLDQLTDKSLVVVLDTASINLLETPDIAEADNVVIIDHHRKGKGSIEHALIDYVDPFSSSASELITELIQYYPLQIEMNVHVATFLLAGIILDTNNFTRTVSSRTFEAASYLRKQGALQNNILNILSTGIKEYLEFSYYLTQADKLDNDGCILCLEGIKSRQDIARAADFLLSFPEIKYTIVLAELENQTVAISARSKGSINIQKIMEHFGGGGHYNNAAAQVENQSVQDVVFLIKEYIKNIGKEE